MDAVVRVFLVIWVRAWALAAQTRWAWPPVLCRLVTGKLQ